MQKRSRSVNQSYRKSVGCASAMMSLTKEMEASLGLELATKRQEHSDLNAAIDTLTRADVADRMLLQRLKKRKLALKDRIVQLENILLPDIIA
ncbi:MAG: hypothetical protein JWP99_1044 [Devosia sp.]|jgi:hypothetical protein|nr:hypothetical protein [Devosia sp.]